MMAKVEINKKAPDFQALDFRGGQISLEDFRGAYHVLLVFNRGFI